MENLFVPQRDGAASTIKPKGNYYASFFNDSMCRYRLIFPQQAGEFDEIKVFLAQAVDVEVTVIETLTYKSSEFKEETLKEGDTYTATFPNEVFLLLRADSTDLNGEFTISYQFNDLDPEEVLRRMT